MMLKKIGLLFICVTLVMGFSTMVFSASKGNARKGKYTFRKNCRSCHDGGKAVAISPDSKTQSQWTRQFKPSKIKKLDCKDQWAKLSEKKKLDIYTYLHKYAFDSPSPAKCK